MIVLYQSLRVANMERTHVIYIHQSSLGVVVGNFNRLCTSVSYVYAELMLEMTGFHALRIVLSEMY